MAKTYEQVLENAKALAESHFKAPLTPKQVECCEAVAWFQSSENPLTSEELRGLAAKRPEKYGFLTEAL